LRSVSNKLNYVIIVNIHITVSIAESSRINGRGVVKMNNLTKL